MSYWKDEEWLERVLVPLCRDRNFLKRMGGILSPDDFKPKKGEGVWEAYYIALKAFEYYRDYKEPIGGLLRPFMMDYVRENKRKIGNKGKDKIIELVEQIKRNKDAVAVEAIEKKIIEYKRRREKSRAVRELISLQEKGELDDSTFDRICRKATERRDYYLGITNYEEEVDKRIKRRIKNSDRQFPSLMINEFDNNLRTFPRGEFGLLLAKYNLGKSTAAIHLDIAYAMQSYNVLHFTLEDSGEMVEDRLDSKLSGIPMRRLTDKSSKLRRRLKRSLEKMRGRIKIIDGSDEGMSIQRIEEVWENYRNQGFVADMVLIDYDEGVLPSEHYKSDSGERREIQEIYKAYKRFLSKRMIWGWMLAQTVRGKSGIRKKIVTGDDAAIDISKVKRCALGLGIGDGPEEESDDARYLNVFKHRYDKARIGWPIMGNYKKATLYDQELTQEFNINLSKKSDS